jgi:hypothetical protein
VRSKINQSNNFKMKKIFLSIATIATFVAANAQTPISLTTTSYTQDFNSLDTSSANSSNLPTGWAIFEVGGSANVNNQYKGGTGASNTGDTYSFGLTNDRALGAVSSGNLRSYYGVGFTNNTGSTITSLTVNYTAEQWRVGDLVFTTNDSVALEYSTVATGVSDTLASWQQPVALMMQSVITSATASGAVDGNAAANKAAKSGTFAVTIPVGGTIYLRWNDGNSAGSDDGLSVDDLNITFGTGVNPKPLIVSTTPLDNATNVAPGTTSLSITFDKPITVGTGSLVITETPSGASQTLNSSNITVNGNTATINGLSIIVLGYGYNVKFDSTLFQSSGNNSSGIYNATDWNFNTPIATPLITVLSPLDNSLNVALNPTLSITFDKAVTQGTGTLVLRNLTDGTQQTINTPSPLLSIAGNTVSATGLTLLAGKKYCVTYDSACFQAAGFNSYGITDTNYWNFFTVPPALNPITTLAETFTVGCSTPIMGQFVSYSVVGNGQAWRCTTFGNADGGAAVMNGFSGGNIANEDWLISAPITTTVAANEMLTFASKKRFTATSATKEVFLSTNYIGTGDPNAATWTPLAVSGLSAIDTSWKRYAAVLPASLTNTYIAFKYVSTAAASDEWSVDDISIAVPFSINQSNTLNAKMWLSSAIGQDRLFVASEDAQQLTISIVDINGKVLLVQKTSLNAGTSNIDLPTTNLASGMYFVRVANEKGATTLKFAK